MAWKSLHKPSGATVIEQQAHGCRLTIMPTDWTKPRGRAAWTATCFKPGAPRGLFEHKRGLANTVKGAKTAALRMAKKLKRGR
jgi:hypothetical protein